MDNSLKLIYQTDYGKAYYGLCEKFINDYCLKKNNRKFNLIFTSPPFPLNRAKSYGNMTGNEYIEWIKNLAQLFKEALAEDGSIVIEIGNAWEKGYPVQSLLPIESLLAFKESGNYYLCQEFIYYNVAKLPTPVEWVNKKRIRVKDSFTRFWWLSQTPFPKANNKNVLVPYSKKMNQLIKSGKYNCGKRPSEHNIGSNSFSKDNGGAIPSNVLIATNTNSKDKYLNYCKAHDLKIHPARMPYELPVFFINFLTEKNDLVLDPFAGSNMTGFACETLERNWISVEAEKEYVYGSIGRFK